MITSNPDPFQTKDLISQKKRFLTTQIHLLNSPLEAISQHTSNAPSIPESELDRIKDKVNQKIKSTNQKRYFLQSQSHVVEQIESLYWQECLREGLPTRKSETVIKKDIDLCDSYELRKLSQTYNDVVAERQSLPASKRRKTATFHTESEEDSEIEDQPEEKMTYLLLREQLLEDSTKRDKLQQKIAALKKLRALIEPFEDPKENVQPNLMTKDNTEIKNELSRMKILMARVGTNLASDLDQGQTDTGQISQMDGKAKLNQILNP